MAKFNATTLIVVAQLALMINLVAGLPIEALNINERDVELEPRARFGGFSTVRRLASKAYRKAGGGRVSSFFRQGGTGREILHNTGSELKQQALGQACGGGQSGYSDSDPYSGMRRRDMENTLEPRARGLAGAIGRDVGGALVDGARDTYCRRSLERRNELEVHSRDLGNAALGNRGLEERGWGDLDIDELD